MAKKQPTVDEVYAWAAEHDVPAPDAFAMTHWYLAGSNVRLNLAAILWRRRVRRGATGFPAIDGE